MSNRIQEAVILAGGLGTRLRSVVSDLPKCLAPVNGKPFLSYIISYLQLQGIRRFVFALGYKSEAFESSLRELLPDGNYRLSIEPKPLGTGGAIQLAGRLVEEENVLIANGDTLFEVDLRQMTDFHFKKGAECTLALKPMRNFSRYGIVELNDDSSIGRFVEKKPQTEGLINGGVYILHMLSLLRKGFPEEFSFEKDYLEKYYIEKKIFGFAADKYFIDIGVPEDYDRAQIELNRLI